MQQPAQIYLFTGENRYRIRQEKRTWVNEFSKKHGSENCIPLSASDVTYASLSDEVSAMPFLAEKRLVIVEGIPRGDADDVKRLPELIHPACILVFIESSPDKRLGVTKALLEISTLKDFPHLSGKALAEWLDSSSQQLGAPLEPAARERLLTIVGDDEDQLWSELQKLVLGKQGASITRDDVERLAIPGGEQEVWLLTNALVHGERHTSLAIVRQLLQRGEDPISLWNILLWFLRQLCAVHAGSTEGIRTPQSLTQKVAVPFPTARTLLPVIDRVKRGDLQMVLREALETDIALKTGGFKSTQEAPQEMLALLDRFVLRVTELFAHPALLSV